MSNLPQPKTSIFNFTNPLTGEKIKFRPFVAKEEKILLMAKESGDEEMIMSETRNVVKACTFDAIDIETLPTFMIEYAFLQIRARSVSETARIKLECINDIKTPSEFPGEDPAITKCGGTFTIEINLLDVQVKIPEGHTNKVIIDDEQQIGICFKYPTVEVARELKNVSHLDMAAHLCPLVDYIYDANSVYPAIGENPEDLIKYIDNLERKAIERIMKQFVLTIPMIEYEHKYKCPKCGMEGKYTFRGIKDFFS